MKGNNSNHEPVGVFQMVVLILSVVVLGALFADTAFKLPPQISNILQTVDTLVCVLLLSDFGVQFYRAKSKLAFMKWGWIDLIASIPNIPILRIGRLVRILRVIRLLRAIRATHKITSIILQDKIKTGFASVILSSFLLVTFASIGILICEQPEPTANIKTAGDAVWWSVATITTVGYGDKYHTEKFEKKYLLVSSMPNGDYLLNIDPQDNRAFIPNPKNLAKLDVARHS